MSAEIISVDQNSVADQLGLRSGDILHSINDHEIKDVIDYMYYSASDQIDLVVERAGEMIDYAFEKDEEEPLGLNFKTYLIEREMHCKNKCVFCFIDQLPKGMRDTLYFKDDDARLSFLMGNYITLTNLSSEDLERIIKMRMSPINISVHATDPETRVCMMKNPHAADLLKIMRRFADAGIEMNCQIVLCRGLNDGAQLDRSLHDLYSLYPAVHSVSIVPVGLSDHRQGLAKLEGFDRESAAQVIDEVTAFGDYCVRQHGCRLFYLSDEFYIMAGRPIPAASYYDGYPQIENGVGLCRSLEDEFTEALAQLPPSDKSISCGIVTGVSAAPLLESFVKLLQKKYRHFQAEVYPIRNDFFGHNITVSGLVTGQDIVRQLKDRKLPKTLFIPRVMLRAQGDMFLDDMTPDQVEQALGVTLIPVINDGYTLLDELTGGDVYGTTDCGDCGPAECR